MSLLERRVMAQVQAEEQRYAALPPETPPLVRLLRIYEGGSRILRVPRPTLRERIADWLHRG